MTNAASFSGIAGVLKGDAPDDMEAALSEAKEQLTEAVAETDDELTERYLEEGDLPLEDIERGLRQGILDGQIAPVLAGSALTGAGVADLIAATTERAARCAAKVLKGDISREIASIKQEIIDIRIFIEGALDLSG